MMLEDSRALSLANPFFGVPSDRTYLVVSILELPAASVPWPNIASARVPVLTSNNLGVRVDDEYTTAYSGY